MRVIKAKIKGAGMGILLHNPAAMGQSNGGKKQIPTPEQEAKNGCYFMDDGETLAIPGWNLFRLVPNLYPGDYWCCRVWWSAGRGN
jgi:hypothetical protein